MKRFVSCFVLFLALAAGEASAQTFDGWYRLQNLFRGEGECLEGNQAGSSVHAGAAFMDKCQNVSGQLWKVVSEGNGVYRLKTQFRGDGECLEGNQAGSSVHAGAAFMDKCQNVSGQLWKLVPDGPGQYRLKTVFRGDGECLEGNQAGSSVHAGAAFMDKCQNVSGQSWKLVATVRTDYVNGYYAFTTTTTPQDRESELNRLAGGIFTRIPGNGSGKAFSEVCQALDKPKTCSKVVAWDGTTLQCSEGAQDGSRMALCERHFSGGFYAYSATTSPQDRELELQRLAGGSFTRLKGFKGGTFDNLCKLVGLKCVTVVAWDGTRLGCEVGANDGSRIVQCN